MSYDISFQDAGTGNTVHLEDPHQLKGGTYALGGTTEAWLNITYNYSDYYYELWPNNGINSLYGKTAGECIPILEDAVEKLGTERSDDYWEPTRGNAGAALMDLLELARGVPLDAVVNGD